MVILYNLYILSTKIISKDRLRTRKDIGAYFLFLIWERVSLGTRQVRFLEIHWKWSRIDFRKNDFLDPDRTLGYVLDLAEFKKHKENAKILLDFEKMRLKNLKFTEKTFFALTVSPQLTSKNSFFELSDTSSIRSNFRNESQSVKNANMPLVVKNQKFQNDWKCIKFFFLRHWNILNEK